MFSCNKEAAPMLCSSLSSSLHAAEVRNFNSQPLLLAVAFKKNRITVLKWDLSSSRFMLVTELVSPFVDFSCFRWNEFNLYFFISYFISDNNRIKLRLTS